MHQSTPEYLSQQRNIGSYLIFIFVPAPICGRTFADDQGIPDIHEEHLTSTGFWIERFLVAFAGAFAIIFAAQMIKGHGLAYSATQGVAWGSIAAAIFTAARIFQSRKGQH